MKEKGKSIAKRRPPDPETTVIVEEIWIIGAGQFGSIAYQRLAQSGRDRHFVLVDPVEAQLRKCQGPAATLEVADGLEFCEKQLNKDRLPDWIIPALPVHLAAEWLLLNLGAENLKRVLLPPEVEIRLPNPIRGVGGDIYVSHADFRCPDNCDEPRDICTVTREMRKQNMFELLGELDVRPFKALNIRSHQLGPGIGGYRTDQLLELRAAVKQACGPVLLSTACRCHGVVTGLERI